MLPVLGAILILLSLPERRSLSALGVSGFLFGLGLLMKQPGVAFVLFGAGYLVWTDFRARLGWKTIATRSVIFACGVGLPIAATFLLLWRPASSPNFGFGRSTMRGPTGARLLLTGVFNILPGTFLRSWATVGFFGPWLELERSVVFGTPGRGNAPSSYSAFSVSLPGPFRRPLFSETLLYLCPPGGDTSRWRGSRQPDRSISRRNCSAPCATSALCVRARPSTVGNGTFSTPSRLKRPLGNSIAIIHLWNQSRSPSSSGNTPTRRMTSPSSGRNRRSTSIRTVIPQPVISILMLLWKHGDTPGRCGLK